jgi:hypothetical protein
MSKPSLSAQNSSCANSHPFVSRFDQPQTFGSIKIVNDSGCFLTQSVQEQGQQFVAHRMLQAAKSANVKDSTHSAKSGFSSSNIAVLHEKLRTGVDLWW